jgi:outer membrane protein OmpA-like peptidoglycan-associated protein
MRLKITIISIMLIPVLVITKSLACAVPTDTLHLYYGIGVYKLSKIKMEQISLVSDSASNGSAIEINGFADYLGTRGFNQGLSVKRAEEVKKYLGSLGRNLSINAKGKGQVPPGAFHTKAGEPANRRVDLIFNKRIVKKPGDIPTLSASPNDHPDPLKEKFRAKVDSLSLIEIGKSIDFGELTFEPGSHRLTPEALPLLKEITNFLANNKSIAFEIRGHICCNYQQPDGFDIDSKTNNLSLNRAKEVYEYFLANGISFQRMAFKGVGSMQPKIYPELSAKDQKTNRRVEIIILSK